MSTEILSPMQHDYVTKNEFSSFMAEVNTRFIEQKFYIDGGFSKAFELSENLEKKIDVFREETNKKFDHLDGRFDRLEDKVNSLTEDVASLSKVVNKIAAKIL